MAQAEFEIRYEGPALAEGVMPVRDLAPALLALGEVFTAASAKTHPDWEPVGLDVRATEKGSFDVHLVLHASDLWDQFVHLFSSSQATALDQFKDFVIGVGGVFLLIRNLRGKRVKKQETVEPGRVRLTLDDGTTLDTSPEVAALLLEEKIRDSARAVVRPLKRSGVEELRFISSGAPPVVIEAADVEAFDTEPEPVPVGEEEVDITLQITSLTWVEGNKWRFSDGASSFHAAIEDPDFLARIDSGERFAKGDTLRVHMRIVQEDRSGKLHSEHFITRVHEHARGRPQLSLTDENADEDDS